MLLFGRLMHTQKRTYTRTRAQTHTYTHVHTHTEEMPTHGHCFCRHPTPSMAAGLVRWHVLCHVAGRTSQHSHRRADCVHVCVCVCVRLRTRAFSVCARVRLCVFSMNECGNTIAVHETDPLALLVVACVYKSMWMSTCPKDCVFVCVCAPECTGSLLLACHGE